MGPLRAERGVHGKVAGLRRLAAAAFLALLPARAGAADAVRDDGLAPGIQHREMRRGECAPDCWSIHVLTLDPERARLEVGRALDQLVGVETTSSLARRRGALAAVNGGFFRTQGNARGEPAGAFAAGGRILSEPDRGRPVVAVGDVSGRARVAFAHWRLSAEASVGGRSFPVAGINRPRGADELVLFTPEFHRTTLTGPDGLEAVIGRDGRVESVRDGSGSSPIPAGGQVLSAAGAARRSLREGLRRGARARVAVGARAEPPFAFAPAAVTSAGPVLLRERRPSEVPPDEPYAEDFRLGRHPRTAIAVREDGTILLVTVDGRQPGKSVGMSLRELADLLVELGAREAYNLDGGGSTTAVVRGAVVNSPSDPTGERPVGDAMLVFAREPRARAVSSGRPR